MPDNDGSGNGGGNNSPEPWVPTSREEWADVFAGGLKKYDAERAEWEAALAEKKAKEQAENGGEGGDGDKPPTRRDVGSILLGRK